MISKTSGTGLIRDILVGNCRTRDITCKSTGRPMPIILPRRAN
jgi:hypothetical protein